MVSSLNKFTLYLKELNGLTRLGIAVILSAICCIFVQINVSEIQTNRFDAQLRPVRFLISTFLKNCILIFIWFFNCCNLGKVKVSSKEEEAEIRALIAAQSGKQHAGNQSSFLSYYIINLSAKKSTASMEATRTQIGIIFKN